jgi:hypothetical protein
VKIKIGDRWVDEFDKAAVEEAMLGLSWEERAAVAEEHPLFRVSPHQLYKTKQRRDGEHQKAGEEPAEPE